jgi:transposase-like protein
VNVWAVHTVLADEVRPTEVVYTDERRACEHAEQLSTDYGVLAATVVRFATDEPGNRRNVAMYVRGVRQEVTHLSDCRRIHGGG